MYRVWTTVIFIRYGGFSPSAGTARAEDTPPCHHDPSPNAPEQAPSVRGRGRFTAVTQAHDRHGDTDATLHIRFA